MTSLLVTSELNVTVTAKGSTRIPPACRSLVTIAPPKIRVVAGGVKVCDMAGDEVSLEWPVACGGCVEFV